MYVSIGLTHKDNTAHSHTEPSLPLLFSLLRCSKRETTTLFRAQLLSLFVVLVLVLVRFDVALQPSEKAEM